MRLWTAGLPILRAWGDVTGDIVMSYSFRHTLAGLAAVVVLSTSAGAARAAVVVQEFDYFVLYLRPVDHD
jgi:hypothetical protein